MLFFFCSPDASEHPSRNLQQYNPTQYLNSNGREQKTTDFAGSRLVEFNLIETLDNTQLDKYIDILKNDLIKKYKNTPTNVDLQLLQNLPSKKIDEYITKINSTLIDFDNNPEKELITSIIDLPKQEPIIPKIEKSEKMFNIYDLSHDSTIFDKKTTNTFQLIVNSQKYTKTTSYHNYLITLDNELQNITCIKISSINKFPIFNNIHQYNIFNCNINGQQRVVKLDNCYCSIQYIIRVIKDAISDIDIVLKDNGHITLIHTGNHSFELLNERNSLLKLLGFQNSYYYSAKEYTSERPHTIVYSEYVHLFLDVFDEPFISIPTNQSLYDFVPIKKILNSPITVQNIGIEFKLENDKNSTKYYDFNEEYHEFVMDIDTDSK